jgi:hypothetical protein
VNHAHKLKGCKHPVRTAISLGGSTRFRHGTAARHAARQPLPPDHYLWSTFGAVTISVMLMAGATEAQAQPRAAGETNNRQCLQAFRLATRAFQSTNAWLFWPIEQPPDLGSKLGLRREGKDISGGHGLVNEPELFSVSSVPRPYGAPTTIFWQQRPWNGTRIAVVGEPFNWQGDTYTTYLLNADVTRDDLESDARKADQEQRYKPVSGRRWNPPLVLIDDDSGASWFIDMGEPYQMLSEWRIRTMNEGAAGSPCTISFRPNMKSAVSVLPEPVRRFAVLLDSTLGSGVNEGTLHPTAKSVWRSPRHGRIRASGPGRWSMPLTTRGNKLTRNLWNGHDCRRDARRCTKTFAARALARSERSRDTIRSDSDWHRTPLS